MYQKPRYSEVVAEDKKTEKYSNIITRKSEG